MFHEGFPFNRRRPQPAPQPAPPPPATAPAAPAPAPRVAPGAQRDRRRSPRQTLVARATLRSDRSLAAACGYVSNISMNGVGFHTRRPLMVGESFHIRIELGPMKWSNRLRVVTCRPHEQSGTFDVGAEFIGNELSVVTGRPVAA